MVSPVRALKLLLAVAIILNFSVVTCFLWTFVWLLCFPLGRRVLKREEDRLYSAYGWVITFFCNQWIKTEYVFYGDELPPAGTNVLLISNHQCSVDWMLLEFLTLRVGAGGHMRYILKKVLRLMPMYGFIIHRHGGIFVRQGGRKDAEEIRRKLKQMADLKQPVWLTLFPEGTRFNPTRTSVLAKSIEFAKEHGLPELHHVLTPRTTGFETVMDVARSNFSVLYDVTMKYEMCEGEGTGQALPPGSIAFLMGKCRKVHIRLRKFEMSSLPEDGEGVKKWLYECFTQKDQWLEALSSPKQKEQTGQSFTPREVPPLSSARCWLGFVVGVVALGVAMFTPLGWQLLVASFLGYTALGTFAALFPVLFDWI